MYSSRSVEDSYELADRLQAAGFENVGAIRALHVQTMRVKYRLCLCGGHLTYAAATVRCAAICHLQGHKGPASRLPAHGPPFGILLPIQWRPARGCVSSVGKATARFNIVNKTYPIVAGKLRESISGGAAVLRTKLPTSALKDSAVIHGFAAYGIFGPLWI